MLELKNMKLLFFAFIYLISVFIGSAIAADKDCDIYFGASSYSEVDEYGKLENKVKAVRFYGFSNQDGYEEILLKNSALLKGHSDKEIQFHLRFFNKIGKEIEAKTLPLVKWKESDRYLLVTNLKLISELRKVKNATSVEFSYIANQKDHCKSKYTVSGFNTESTEEDH